MKRTMLMVFSIVLILASIFGLFACVSGVRDIMNINEYKNADAAYAKDNLKVARDGISQLKDNEQTYITGVGTYTDGLAEYTKGVNDYNSGAAQIAAGEAQLAQGEAKLAAGKKKLAEGEAAYAAGQKELAEGQARIDANTQAYNEGKQKLAMVDQIMPYVNTYVQLRDGVVSSVPFGGVMLSSAQAYLSMVLIPAASSMGMSIPAGTTDIPAYMQQMVAEGKAQLKEYEDGLATLEAGKARLAAAEQELAAGRQEVAEGEKSVAEGRAKLASSKQQLAAGGDKLAAGKAQLDEGAAQLTVFEQGELTLTAGARQLFEGMQPCFAYYSGKQTVDSLPEYLAKEFGVAIPDNLIVVENGKAHVNEEAYAALGEDVIGAMYKVDESGNIVQKNGYPMLDLDKYSIMCDRADQYLADQEADIKGEVIVRIVMYLVLAVASVLGIIAGIMGITGAASGNKRTGKTLCCISAVLSVAVLITGLATRFNDYVYTIRVDQAGNYVGETAAKLDYVPVHEYSGSLHLWAIIIMAAASVLCAIFAIMASNAAKKRALAGIAEAEYYADADAASAAAAAEAAAASEAAPVEDIPDSYEEAPTAEPAPAPAPAAEPAPTDTVIAAGDAPAPEDMLKDPTFAAAYAAAYATIKAEMAKNNPAPADDATVKE